MSELHDKIKKMAEAHADKCFKRDSFRWQKVVQHYTQGILDWIGTSVMEDLHKQEDGPPYSMPNSGAEDLARKQMNAD